MHCRQDLLVGVSPDCFNESSYGTLYKELSQTHSLFEMLPGHDWQTVWSELGTVFEAHWEQVKSDDVPWKFFIIPSVQMQDK